MSRAQKEEAKREYNKTQNSSSDSDTDSESDSSPVSPKQEQQPVKEEKDDMFRRTGDFASRFTEAKSKILEAEERKDIAIVQQMTVTQKQIERKKTMIKEKHAN